MRPRTMRTEPSICADRPRRVQCICPSTTVGLVLPPLPGSRTRPIGRSSSAGPLPGKDAYKRHPGRRQSSSQWPEQRLPTPVSPPASTTATLSRRASSRPSPSPRRAYVSFPSCLVRCRRNGGSREVSSRMDRFHPSSPAVPPSSRHPLPLPRRRPGANVPRGSTSASSSSATWSAR